MKRELTQKHLKELLNYDPESGVFTWKLKRTGFKSKDGQAGSIQSMGYRTIWLNGGAHKAHRLAWLYMTGNLPDLYIDHINGEKDDNRWCNLREATHAQNMWNTRKLTTNRSGLQGVSWHMRVAKWCAQVSFNGKKIHIGYFDCPAAAHLAYVVWADINHGEFAKVA